MNVKQKMVLPFEVKDVSVEGVFTGMASLYGVTDLGGDVVERGAFTKTISEQEWVPVLWMHKAEEVIGKGMLRGTREGLEITGTLDMEDPTALKAFRKLKMGLMKGLSIGFQSVQDEVKNGVRHLKEIKLWEVSIVTFPMLTSAAVTGVKQLVLDHKADFNTELAAAETWAKRYQMISALDESLSSIIWSNSVNEDKVAQATESVNQFAETFLAFLPQYLALMDSRYKSAVELFDQKSGAELLSAHSASIAAAAKEFQALLDPKAAERTPEKPAAVPEAATGNKSAIQQFLTEMESQLKWTL